MGKFNFALLRPKAKPSPHDWSDHGPYTPPRPQPYEDFGLPSPELFFNAQPEVEDDFLTGLLSPEMQSLFGEASLESLPIKRWAILLKGSISRVDYIPFPRPPATLPAQLAITLPPDFELLYPHSPPWEKEVRYWLELTEMERYTF